MSETNWVFYFDKLLLKKIVYLYSAPKPITGVKI